MLAGKSDEERVQLETDIVNARDDFMKRVAERVASTFICYNFDPNEEPARFDDVRWNCISGAITFRIARGGETTPILR